MAMILALISLTFRCLSVYEYELTVQGTVSFGSARVVMVIVVGNGHGDTSSNPGRD